jgi:hypothetical protein
MKKSLSVIIALFIISAVFSQNKKGVIYEYKKNQATVAVGSSGNVELGYFRRFTKNFSIGLSLGRVVAGKYSYISGGDIDLELQMYDSGYDGWQGGYLEYYVNGNFTEYFYPSGGYGNEELNQYLVAGDSYSFVYITGDDQYQVEYNINSGGETQYIGDGYTSGTVYSGVYNPNSEEVTVKNVVLPLFFDLKYNFLVRKRLQPSLIVSPGVNLSEFDGLVRYGFGLDYHFKSDDHVITAMANTFNYGPQPFNSFTLRYSYKF